MLIGGEASASCGFIDEPVEQRRISHGEICDMTLGSPRSTIDNSHHIHAADVADQSQPSEHSKALFAFKTNDFVVYPAHGVGQIVAIEDQTVAGVRLEFLVVNFVKNKMTLRVPTEKVANAGMRELSDPAAIAQVRQILSQAPNKARVNWSRLAQEYGSKINSGDIIAAAEVVRDLYRPGANSNQSFSERQLYVAALDRLIGEIALVENITETEAEIELESLVISGAGRKR
jgi:CarD family transcriptional regulator